MNWGEYYLGENYTINFYRLVWKSNTTKTNAFMTHTTMNFYNVYYSIAYNSADLSYYIPRSTTYKLQNCTLPKNVTNMLRTTHGTIRLQNCYGGFTNGYGSAQSSWDYKTNYITTTPKVDSTTYRITDNESVWKDVGTGNDLDGTAADLGVYGGEYSWEYEADIDF